MTMMKMDFAQNPGYQSYAADDAESALLMLEMMIMGLYVASDAGVDDDEKDDEVGEEKDVTSRSRRMMMRV